jgi:uncharacterized protein YaeQ
MAIKPTIFKLKISLSDLDRNYFDTLNLIIAQHPSETIERMMARVLAFCINAEEHLVFTRGLSSIDEPDIWARTLDDRISLWIDVGEPALDRVKKATTLSPSVKVYSFNNKSRSDVWWQKGQSKFSQLNVSVYQFHWQSIQALAGLVLRTMNFSVMISGNSAFVSTASGDCEVPWIALQASS